MNIGDIATLAGVSKTTVSYVLNGRSQKNRISQATQDKVWTLVKKHNFVPNPVAKSLRHGRTKFVGLVIPDLDHAENVLVVNSIEKLVRDHDFRMILCCSESCYELETKLVGDLRSRVDAIVVCTYDLGSLDAGKRKLRYLVHHGSGQQNQLNGTSLSTYEELTSTLLAELSYHD